MHNNSNIFFKCQKKVIMSEDKGSRTFYSYSSLHSNVAIMR